MKNKIIMCILLVIVLLSVVSCSDNAKNQPTTVTVWTYYNGTAKNSFDSMVSEFNKTVGHDNNIIIDAYTQGDVNQLADDVLAAANQDVGADKMPHIFATYPESALVIDKLGLVTNLDDYFSQAELAKYRLEFIEGGRFNKANDLKIIPIAKSSECIFLNKTDFEKFTNETKFTADLSTWEGLAVTAKKYYEWTDAKTLKLNDGKAFFGIDSMANFMIIATKQLGNEIYKHNGDKIDIDFSKTVARKIWDNFYVPFVSGHYAAIGRFRSDDAKTGDLIAYIGSTAGAAYFPSQIEMSKDTAYPIECSIYPYPCFVDAQPIIIEQGAGMAVAKSDAVHEKAAVLFLKWFTKNEQNLTFAVQTGYLPVKNEALSFEKFKTNFNETPSDSHNKAILDCAQTAYKMLDECTLYSTKPFEASFDARKVLENSLVSYAKSDLEAINSKLTSSSDKSKVLEQFITEENFEKWYNSFISEISVILK